MLTCTSSEGHGVTSNTRAPAELERCTLRNAGPCSAMAGTQFYIEAKPSSVILPVHRCPTESSQAHLLCPQHPGASWWSQEAQRTPHRPLWECSPAAPRASMTPGSRHLASFGLGYHRASENADCVTPGSLQVEAHKHFAQDITAPLLNELGAAQALRGPPPSPWLRGPWLWALGHSHAWPPGCFRAKRPGPGTPRIQVVPKASDSRTSVRCSCVFNKKRQRPTFP